MMRSVLIVLAAIAATTISAAPVAAKELRKPQVVAAKAAQLRLATPTVESRASKVYLVRLAAQPAASYKGGLSGFARTAATSGGRYDARSGQSEAYTRMLQSQQDALLASIGVSSERKIYSYVHTLNGFAARLTPIEAAKLRKNKQVLNVWEDRLLKLDTNNSPQFLGITNSNNGLRGALGLTGEGVIIGVVDSGIVQEHPSFEDNNYDDPPSYWSGICQTGQQWSSSDCTNKIIGARWFVSGFTSGSNDLADGEFFSARDSDGHGTHTASTAGGNKTKATLNGAAIAPISGMAYRAHIAAYKSCWLGPDFTTTADDGCTFSDSAAAVDAAVSDGVDVINFSVGTSPDFNDPVDLAFLGALDAGVFVARSAGNEGPGASTTAAGEPWVFTVGASTQRGTSYAQATSVNAPVSVAGDFPSLEGAITQPLVDSGDVTGDLALADPQRACEPIAPVTGVVLILRGTCDFTVKITNAVNAGATGVIVFTDDRPKTIMGGAATPETLSVPGVMVDRDVGRALRTEISNGATVNVTLSPTTFLPESMVGNIMAGFSSRGPFPTEPSWIKPDGTAPGVQILAGGTPEPADGSTGDFFQYLQGTSMSSPHVAGIGALLREAHPDWSPAAIKSALMTTARTNVTKEDGVSRANPFDFGSGHIVPNLAVDPGLVYDTDTYGQLAGTCGTVTPLVDDDDCALLESLGYFLGASNLNLASIGVNGVLGNTVVHRTVTNVSDTESTYTAWITPPGGFRVVVEPATLTLGPGESASFEVRIRNRAAPSGVWRFGSLVWSDGTHSVRSPIAVNAQALLATAAIEGTGPDGEDSIDVAFGFNGAYTAAAHGIAEPNLSLGEIEDDPANSFDFDFGPDEPITFLADLPAGTAYAQWSIFDAYNDRTDHDLDMYLFYCPDFACTLIDSSLGATGEESVSVRLPAIDDSIDDPYVVFIHGYQTAGGATATAIQFDWQAADDLGNLTVSGPSSATIGGTDTVDLQWTGLTTGPGSKQVGAVSHSDANGAIGVTSINITNDEGGGFCDLVAC